MLPLSKSLYRVGNVAALGSLLIGTLLTSVVTSDQHLKVKRQLPVTPRLSMENLLALAQCWLVLFFLFFPTMLFKITYLWETKLVVAPSRCFSAFQLLAIPILRVHRSYCVFKQHCLDQRKLAIFPKCCQRLARALQN